MKCPACGAWNRAHMPVCVRCGADLTFYEETAPGAESWRAELRDDRTGAAYYRMDEEQQSDATPDERDILAGDMMELKQRKAEGERKQRRLRRESIGRGTPVGVQITSRTASTPVITPVEEPLPRRRTASQAVVRYVGRPNSAGTGEEEYVPGTASYDPLWEESQQNSFQSRRLPRVQEVNIHSRRHRKEPRRLLTVLLILVILGILVPGGYFGWQYFQDRAAAERELNRPAVEASIMDDLATHTIKIPGKDGSQIYIRELHNSYIVTGSYATIQVPDHIWYDDKEDLTEQFMDVTLTPFLKTESGRQQPLDPIVYTIEIPLSPIEMIAPETDRITVASSMYTMQFEVRPGSKVTVNRGTPNERDISDTVNAQTGALSFNYTVQPIGDNPVTITVRSQYCREHTISLVIYREPQEVPLDLAADTFTSTSRQTMDVHCSTQPGATVDVLSPYTDLNISELDKNGRFSFKAVFDHIGDNVIRITSSFPGKRTSSIEYTVYYVPSVDIYTKKAWGLTRPEEYSELVSNINVRAERTQVYVVTGVLQYFVSTKPQMAVFNCSEDDQSHPVVVQNYTRTTWEKGKYYRLYADAFGTYDNMPWLNARFTYDH